MDLFKTSRRFLCASFQLWSRSGKSPPPRKRQRTLSFLTSVVMVLIRSIFTSPSNCKINCCGYNPVVIQYVLSFLHSRHMIYQESLECYPSMIFSGGYLSSTQDENTIAVPLLANPKSAMNIQDLVINVTTKIVILPQSF